MGLLLQPGLLTGLQVCKKQNNTTSNILITQDVFFGMLFELFFVYLLFKQI